MILLFCICSTTNNKRICFLRYCLFIYVQCSLSNPTHQRTAEMSWIVQHVGILRCCLFFVELRILITPSHYKDKPVPIFSGGRYSCLVPPPPLPPPPILFSGKIYSYLFITDQTLFSSTKPQFYYIRIFKLIYAYYSAS